jgi:K+-sensing histidine kinase KdpD
MSYAPIRVLIPMTTSFYRTPKAREKEKAFYIGEISLIFLTLVESLVCIIEKKWIGVYVCVISLLLFACFLWAYRQSKLP